MSECVEQKKNNKNCGKTHLKFANAIYVCSTTETENEFYVWKDGKWWSSWELFDIEICVPVFIFIFVLGE